MKSKTNSTEKRAAVVVDAPARIFLQWNGDQEPDPTTPPCLSEVTWCKDRVFGHDVEYVRASTSPVRDSTDELVRMAFVGNGMHVSCVIPECVALTVAHSAADSRLASILRLIAEHDQEPDAEEKSNIRRTLAEILENAPVLFPNVSVTFPTKEG
jgi:hypothetical protein